MSGLARPSYMETVQDTPRSGNQKTQWQESSTKRTGLMKRAEKSEELRILGRSPLT